MLVATRSTRRRPVVIPFYREPSRWLPRIATGRAATGFAAALALGVAVALGPVAKAAAALPVTRNIQVFAHLNEYPPAQPTDDAYSACWAYVHPDGREYAALGTYGGTAIYNITNPGAPYRVALIAGPPSIWREMKSYRTWLYIVTEGTGAGQGLQIVRMTDPEHPALIATYTTGFVRSHTVSVDTARAILICNGTRNASGYAAGMHVLSLASPEAPVELTWWPGGSIPVSTANYIHDCEPVGNRLYGSSIYVGTERVFDFTNPAAITQLSQWTYPNAFYTHSAWPDSAGGTLYVADEQNGQNLRVFDLSNLAAPALVNELTSNPLAIVHNPRVKGHELYLANYTEGIRVLDITDPAHPAEFAYADSWAGPSGGYYGVWECCPYFPSGTVIASDLQSGLYVYGVQRNYGLVRVKVVDQSSGLPIAGVPVVVPSTGDSAATAADGILQFAPDPGTRTLYAVRPGYPYASATVNVSAGSRDTVLLALPTGSIVGKVRDAESSAALEDAQVDLAGHAGSQHTDSAGQFAWAQLPEDDYNVSVRASGHVPLAFTRHVGPSTGGQDFYLTPTRTWDALETDLGWAVGALGDDATTGIWVRGVPIGSGAPQAAAAPAPRWGAGASGPAGAQHEPEGEGDFAPGDVQPAHDRTPPPGTQCFVTGQGTPGGSVGENDVDNGRTSLTSPAIDLTALSDPVIGFWRWFYTRDADGSDWFATLISNDNGATWVAVDTIYGNHPRWEERALRVSDFVTPSAQTRVRFVAADLNPGGIVEAAVDDIVTYEASGNPTAVAPPPDPSRLSVRIVGSNPAPGRVRFSIVAPPDRDLRVALLDVAGRVVRSLYAGRVNADALALEWDGRDRDGRSLPAGLYFARVAAGDQRATVRFVRVR